MLDTGRAWQDRCKEVRRHLHRWLGVGMVVCNSFPGTRSTQEKTRVPMERELKGECGKCSHVFVIAHLPMELSKVATLMKAARCPKCASARPIYLAKEVQP
jgi:hypothetical protein